MSERPELEAEASRMDAATLSETIAALHPPTTGQWQADASPAWIAQIRTVVAAALLAAHARGRAEGLEAAAQKADEWANSKSCDQHDDNPCCHVRTGSGIAAAIRALGGKE